MNRSKLPKAKLMRIGLTPPKNTWKMRTEYFVLILLFEEWFLLFSASETASSIHIYIYNMNDCFPVRVAKLATARNCTWYLVGMDFTVFDASHY